MTYLRRLCISWSVNFFYLTIYTYPCVGQKEDLYRLYVLSSEIWGSPKPIVVTFETVLTTFRAHYSLNLPIWFLETFITSWFVSTLLWSILRISLKSWSKKTKIQLLIWRWSISFRSYILFVPFICSCLG